MSRPLHAVPRSAAAPAPVPGPEQLQAQALLALARARYDWFRTEVGLPMPAWDDLTDAARLGWSNGLGHFVPVVLAAGEERRHRARFTVGARDTTDGQGDTCCLASCGPWDCTRKPHTDQVHAAGTGGVIVAAWELA